MYLVCLQTWCGNAASVIMLQLLVHPVCLKDRGSTPLCVLTRGDTTDWGRNLVTLEDGALCVCHLPSVSVLQ